MRSSVWDEHETSFDRCGQARVFLVHVVLRSETRHALLTGVLSDVDELCREREKYSGKPVTPCQSAELNTFPTDPSIKHHESRQRR